MPGFKANFEHNLGKMVALEKLKSFSEEVRAKYGSQISDMEENWDDDGNLQFGFKALGLKISGNLAVDDQQARLCSDRKPHLLADLQTVLAAKSDLIEEEVHLPFKLGS